MKHPPRLSIVKMKISRDYEPFKDETPAVFKLLTNVKTYTEGASLDDSFSTSANLTKNSCRYVTLNIPRSAIVPEVVKRDFDNPYLFAKNPKSNGGKVSQSNFAKGFEVNSVMLNKQRKHFDNHLQNSCNEVVFRDSKANKSRKYAQYLNCTNPITQPKFNLDGPTRRHFNDEQTNPTPILKSMNTRILGNKFIENRREIKLSDLRQLQDNRSRKEHNEYSSQRKYRDSDKMNQMRNTFNINSDRKQRSASSFNLGMSSFSNQAW